MFVVLQDKTKLWVEVCNLKINFHMIILIRMQMNNQNTDYTPRLVQKTQKD